MPPSAWRKQTPLLILALTLLTGCAQEAPDAAIPAPPIIVVHCATVVELSQSEQKQAALELSALPESSVIGNKIVPDWIRTRDESRACEKANTPPPPAPPK